MAAIILEKGQRIQLEKDGNQLSKVSIGVNWGAIKSGWFGKEKPVDLDASVGMFDAAGKLLEKVYFGRKQSSNGAIQHSGDDRSGDIGGDDGKDNETITVDLARIPEEVKSIAFVIDSYTHIDFDSIPYAGIKVYEGAPKQPGAVLAKYEIAHDAKFKGSVSMILCKVYRHNNAWKFQAIGEPTKANSLTETLDFYAKNFL